MKRKRVRVVGIALGVLIFLFIFLGLGGPIMVRLGMEPLCIQGKWPHLDLVSCNRTQVVSPTVTPIALPDQNKQAPIPVIVDDDGSPDGTIALLYFLSNPIFNVQAVTISQGEAHPDLFVEHILQLLAGLGRMDIPVGAGSPVPLAGYNAFPDPWREASDHFWDIELPPTTTQSEESSAAELIVETVNNSTQPILVFISGSHTNLADAFRLDPGIVENIQNVYIMGGSVYVPGNIHSDWPEIDNRVAEWNIWADPVAANEVFDSGLPLHLIPLDATRKVTWTPADLTAWSSSGSPEGMWAEDLLHWMLNSWSPEGVYIWDLTAAIVAANPFVCPEVSLALDIVTSPGPEQGQTRVIQDDPNIYVCLDPDIGQIKSLSASSFGK